MHTMATGSSTCWLSRLLSLAATTWLATVIPRACASTQSYPYQFNHVAVTGGGYITGIIAHPTEPKLMYVRTDIGGAYRWEQDENKWIPLTDFVSAADSNLLGTEAIGLDPTDPDRLYLAQGRYLTSNNTAFFVSSDRGATFDVYPAPFPMGSNELGRNNGERLAVNPFSPDEVWFGTRTEGLWKSTDRAKTWTNVTSVPDAFANNMGIYFVIFDPRQSGTIYVGGSTPGGLYRTQDHGRTWEAVPGQPTTWDNSTLVAGEAPLSAGPQPMKAVLTSDGATLYVTYADFPGPYGVQYGYVYRFDTARAAWTNVTPGVGNNSYPPPYAPQAWPPGGFCGVSVDAGDPDTLVVTTLDRDPGPALDSLYLSRDGGRSWRDVAQLSSPPGAGGYWGHPIAEAALENGTGVPWLSFDWGGEWGGYGAPSPVRGLAKFGWWMSALLMDPSDPGHVMYGTGATIWSTDDVLAAERNQPPEWYIQAQGIEETFALAMISPSEGPAHLLSGFGDINGMRHDDLWEPQPMFGLPAFSNLDSLDWAGQKPSVVARVGDCGLAYPDGCGQGAYSTDSGGNWTKFPTCAPGIGPATTTDGVIAVDASGEHFVWSTLVAAQDGGPWASADAGATWTAPAGDLRAQTPNVSADRVRPGTFYACDDDAGTFYLSTDGGRSYAGTPASSLGLPGEGGSCAPPVVNFNRAGELWLALGARGLWHSGDFGGSWERVGPAGLQADFFSVGRGPEPGAPADVSLFLWGRVAASGPGSVDGLYRSDDAGESWARVNDEAHQYGGPELILGDPRVYGRVYIGTGGRGIVYADIAGHASSGGSVANVPGTAGI